MTCAFTFSELFEHVDIAMFSMFFPDRSCDIASTSNVILIGTLYSNLSTDNSILSLLTVNLYSSLSMPLTIMESLFNDSPSGIRSFRITSLAIASLSICFNVKVYFKLSPTLIFSLSTSLTRERTGFAILLSTSVLITSGLFEDVISALLTTDFPAKSLLTIFAL